MLKLNISKKERYGRMNVKYPNVLKKIEVIQLGYDVYVYEDGERVLTTEIM